MKRILTVILTFCFINLVQSTNYFSAPHGVGDGSSYSKPTNLIIGISKLKNPGDTLFLLGGQYDLSSTLTIQSKTGTEKQSIVITSYPNEYAILDFRKQEYEKRGVEIKSCTYLTIKRLCIRYAGKNGLWNSSHYCTFEQLDVYGNSDSGIQMKGGTYNHIINCDSHDNFDYKLDKSGKLTEVDFGGNADGFADKQFTGAGNYYFGCRAWNNSDDGWDCYERITDGMPTVIENCICYQNGPTYYDMSHHPRYEIDKEWFDQFATEKQVTTRSGSKVTVTLQKYCNQGNANGFKLGGNNTEHMAFLHHCLATGNKSKGFDQNSNNGTMTIYNCSADANKTNFGFSQNKYGALAVRNSLSYRASNSINCKKILANDFNSWNYSTTITEQDFVSIDTTEILGTRQADGSLPIMTYLHLSTTSSMIDKGTDIGIAYTGKAPDLGCFEHGLEYIIAPEKLYMTDPDPDNLPLEPENKNGKKIAFVTVPQSEADRDIILYLRNNPEWSVWIMDASKTHNYADFDLVILSPVPSSALTGAKELQSIEKPFLLLKPFMTKSTIWNWASPANSTMASMTITQPNHQIFANLSNKEELTLYSSVTTNGVAYVNDWHHNEYTTLATIYDSPAILESGKMLMVGLSEYSSADITDDGLLLISNCISYLLNSTSNLNNNYKITTKSGIYDVLGHYLGTDETNLPHGFYIINGKKHIR